VVLSMLTLFLLIGTAFIVSANHYRQTMKIQGKLTERSNSSIDQGDLLNEVINQIIRDTHNQNSSLRFHSLLRDMYGNDGILAEITIPDWAGGNQTLTGGQMVEFQVYLNTANLNDPRNPKDGASIPVALSNVNNAYNGLVLTFLDGAARGESTRITSYVPASGTLSMRFRVMSPRLANGTTLTSPNLLAGSRILINGRPFNGTGVGYNPFAAANTARLTTTENYFGTSRSLALTPNSATQSLLLNTDAFDDPQVADLRFLAIGDEYYFTDSQIAAINQDLDDRNITDLRDRNLEFIRLKNLIGTPGLGGSDESYDAVDFQNMMLSLMPTNPVETVLPGQPLRWPDTPTDWPTAMPNNLGAMVIPSLHRPALINYWNSQVGNLEVQPNLLRKAIMRPSWFDHPNFTGSNPDMSSIVSDFRSALENTGDPLNDTEVQRFSDQLLRRMIYGPWDVDNDNDGIRDSVWVDFGAPVMENSDGRLVKPLAAILVLDMDGRLNLNAHGSEDITSPTNFNVLDGVLAGGNDTDNLPQGQGYGPAEISLEPLVPWPNNTTLTALERRTARRNWYWRF